MSSRTTLYARRVILVGLMTAFGLISAASQAPTDSELAANGMRPDQRSVTKPVLARVASGSMPTTADPSVNGTRLQGSIGRGNSLWAIPLTSLSATRERPIFSPTRRPPPAAQSSAKSVSSPLTTRPPLALVGAIAGEMEGIAIFLDQTTKGTIRLKTGESYLGWMLQLVKGREAILQKELKTAIFSLPNPPAK
jgi:hypothetical protein